MDLTRLMRPRSIAVVGATPRAETYAHETLRNLAALGYDGEVWGVHPTHREVLGREVFASLSDLPAPADAVVVAIPAAGVPDVIAEAGASGCGGAVVFGAGFADGGDRALQDRLVAAALRHALPVIGPNCDGMVRLHERAALWGDALRPQPAGGVALVSQSGNLAVNALATRRGLRLHTVVSCGNQAVLDAGDLLAFLAEDEGVRSVALYLEDDGDAPRLCEALARCADRGVGVAVLKAGASAVGATAAATHTGAIAGDHRVFRALVEEAGAAWARDGHEVLELAKALAVRAAGARARRRARHVLGRGLRRRGRRGGAPRRRAPAARRGHRGAAARAAAERRDRREPARLHRARLGRDGDAARHDRDARRRRRRSTRCSCSTTSPRASTAGRPSRGRTCATASSPARPRPTRRCSSRRRCRSCSTTRAPPTSPRAGSRRRAGCARGCSARWRCSRSASAAAERLRAIGAAAAAVARGAHGAPGGAYADGRWLAEHEAKALLRGLGVPVVAGRVARDEDDALAAAGQLGWPVALKRSVAGLRHKTEAGALALGVADEATLRREYRRLAAGGGAVLVEAMAAGAVELIVAARRDAVVPALVIGMGGVWAELLDDAAVVPLPATPARVAAAIRSLRGAPLLCGGRGRTPLDVDAAAELAAMAGDVLLAEGLELLELNPVLVSPHEALALDAVVREGPTRTEVAA